MNKAPDFRQWENVLSGSELQRSAREVLHDSSIFHTMAPYSPILCGSMPLDIGLEQSDVDISCFAPNLEEYIYFALDQFKGKENFYLKIKEIREEPSIIVRFTHRGRMIELFTQRIPVDQQHSYLHMLIEWHILNELGPLFRSEVMSLRTLGMKVEPAFAHLLRLRGDPYMSLLDYGVEKGYIPDKKN